MIDQNDKIDIAIRHLCQGKMVVLVDDDSRENEGDLVIAAEKVNPENINFMIRHGGGLICMPITPEHAEQLQLNLQPKRNIDPLQQAPFTITIDAAKGNSTGISAQDRANTILTACNPAAKPIDLVTPGHVFPLLAQKNGVFARQGHTEGSIDLMKIAGLAPASVICEILDDAGQPAIGPSLQQFAQQHSLPIVSIRDIIDYRMKHESLVHEYAKARLPIEGIGDFQMHSFENDLDHKNHLALVKVSSSGQLPLVRVHSECLTGDIFGSARCDCGVQLQKSLELIGEQGGILCYLRQEGRGIGLTNKLRAYALQDRGADTVEANLELGFKADERDYCMAAQMLKHFGADRIRLITNNPKKIAGLESHGIEVVERVSIECALTEENKIYLTTKRDKLGHLLDI